MRKSSRRSENGQSLALLLLLMFGFFVILALVIDGGNTYFQRRNAQNAADAGALAGARVYCETLDSEAAKIQAKNFVNANEAIVHPIDSYNDVTISENKVTVATSINYPTFIGNVIGRGDITATADATAGCFSPTLAEGVLPIIWYCKPSLTGEVGEDPKCIEQFIEWDQLQGYLSEDPFVLHDELYVVMDDLKLPAEGLPCIEDDPDNGYYTCDWDGDGKLDKIGSARGWTDLDGWDNNPANPNCYPDSTSNSELQEWITNGYECELDTHTWTPKTNFSVTNPLFDAIECRIYENSHPGCPPSKGPLVLLPVYDDDCPQDTPAPNKLLDCKPPLPPEIKWHNDLDTIRLNNPAENPYYFHIVHFAPFYITCVRGNKSYTPYGQVETCPGYEKLAEKNPSIKGQDTRSVEGYFLWGYVPGLKGRGDDDFLTNVFTVYLDE